jgi:hypothetical protein
VTEASAPIGRRGPFLRRQDGGLLARLPDDGTPAYANPEAAASADGSMTDRIF